MQRGGTENFSGHGRRLPFDRDGHQRENAAANGQDGHELWDFAVDGAVRPVAGQHEGKVEDDVERRDHGVGDGQVDQKVIGDCPHPPVGHDDPDDH